MHKTLFSGSMSHKHFVKKPKLTTWKGHLEKLQGSRHVCKTLLGSASIAVSWMLLLKETVQAAKWVALASAWEAGQHPAEHRESWD